MAHGAVTMDRISKGRLDLGFGGGIPRLLESMGIKKEEGALQECVGVVRSLLGGGKTTFSGNTFKINEVELPRLPYDKDIPIYVAAMDEKGFRVAREVSDGVLTISANAKFLRRALEWISGGSDAIPLGTWLPFSLSKEKLFTYLQRLVSNLPQGFWALTEMDKDRLSREELVDTFAVCGEGDLREKIERLENLGIAEIIFEYMNLTELEALEFFLRGYQ